MNYFIQDEDRPTGPLTAEQIRLRIREHGLNAFDLVRRGAEEPWRALASMEEFAAARPNAPPMDARPLGNPLAMVSLLLVFMPLVASTIFMPTCGGSLQPEVQWLCIVLIALGILLGHAAVKRSKTVQNGFGGRLIARAALTIGYCFILMLYLPHIQQRHIQERGNMAKAINNCRQIITTLKLYSSDCSPKYPDYDLPNARTSNEIFRQAFVMGVGENEFIFGCPSSCDGKPDGNIGTEPDFKEALKPGENHWAMTKGLTDSDAGNIPLVYESPADATWPPTWNPDYAGTTKPGRTWSGGRVIIGFKDGSVAIMPL